MKKFLLMFMVALLGLSGVFGQQQALQVKMVAILDVVDKVGNVDEFDKLVVRSNISTAITNTQGYKSLERLDLSKILDEQSFQRTGMVSDAQIKKMGEMFGADYVLIVEVAAKGTNLFISARIVNAETTQRLKEANQLTTNESEKLQKACEELAAKLLGASAGNPGGSGRPGSPRPGAGRNYVENTWNLNMEMVYVEGGDFFMGCTDEQGGDCFDNEKNVRRVSLSSYYIGATEVTQAQWKAVMGSNPSNWKGDDLPVESVSWEDAMSFCQELSRKTGKTYTLPTEAQWEFAARGGNKKDGNKYSGGYSMDLVGWYSDNSGSRTHPVKQKRGNGLGLYDMSGNVWEWCKDWWGGSYNTNDRQDPQGPSSGSYRVSRGGSWSNYARYCRVSNRDYNTPSGRYGNVGFRVVMLP